MDRKEANSVLKVLQQRYPSKYPANIDTDFAKMVVDDLIKFLGRYEVSDVLEGLQNWAKSNKFPPLMADWEVETQKAKRCVTPISQEEFDTPTVWSKYCEDNDGCGYAINSKTGEFDCIWKWWWANKGLEKAKVLKEHGINYGV